MNQKVDGLLDITANATGTFYNPGRTTLIPAGQGNAADILDWDDSEMTSISAQLGWTMTKAWSISAGYAFEQYDYKDAMSATSKLMPSSMNIFTKPNDGKYDASIVYTKLTFKF
jgi:outer membrane receptor for ferric coprogen and ferric-rhodotorulic acid